MQLFSFPLVAYFSEPEITKKNLHPAFLTQSVTQLHILHLIKMELLEKGENGTDSGQTRSTIN